MKYLRPFILFERYFFPVEEEIQRAFNDIFYKKLFAIVRETEYLNAITNLLGAVRTGRVYYENGEFKGRFSAKITMDLREIGAKYNRETQTWFLAQDLLPTDIKFALALAETKMQQMRQQIYKTLDDIEPQQLDLFDDIKKKYNTALEAMETDFRKAAKAITIVPKLSDQQRETIANDYTNNLDLYIKGWVEENIPKLRAEVQEHALKGGRAESLAKTIEQNYEVSKAKAKFLARQETSLMMSKFRETRYADIGVKRYRWSGANDERERPDHKKLNGKVFSFDNPPITCTTGKNAGARNNPGEDFGCRCIAVGIVE